MSSSPLFEDPPDIRIWHPSYVYESPILGSAVPEALHSNLQLEGSKMVRTYVKRARNVSADYGQEEAVEITHPKSTNVVHTSPTSRGRSFRPDLNDLGIPVSQLPSDEEDCEIPSEDMTGTLHRKVRKKRGPTCLSDIFDLPKGTKLPISWNSKGEPTGKNRSRFASFCGIIARNPLYAPLQVEKFYKIPERMKSDMFKLVCAHFDLDEGSDTIMSIVLSSIGKKYGDHLNKLKRKHFLKFKTNEERLKFLPPDMEQADWEFLVNKWSSEKHTVLSEKNSRNREFAELRHTSGPISHANVLDDETKKNDGVPPTEYNSFLKLRTHKSDGTPADPKTARIISLVEEQTSKIDVGRTKSACQDAIFKVVRGPVKKKGRARYTSSLDNGRVDELERRLAETEAARQLDKAVIEDIQNKYDSVMAALQKTGQNGICSEAPFVDSDETQEG